jgi:hypothetical protein
MLHPRSAIATGIWPMALTGSKLRYQDESDGIGAFYTLYLTNIIIITVDLK